MRIAVSAENDNGLESTVSHHFGRCPYFVIADIEGDEITGSEVVVNPHHQAHKPGEVPAFIHGQSADAVVCGGMGRRAIALFAEQDVATATGASGTAREAIGSYLSGSLHGAAPCRESVEHSHHEDDTGHE